MTSLQRRSLLALVASGGVSATAGCLGTDDSDDTGPSEDDADDENGEKGEDDGDDDDPPEPTFDVPDGWRNLTGTDATPNGVWSWFSDERAIVDMEPEAGPRLLVGSVAGGGEHAGDVNLTWWDFEGEAVETFTLHEGLEEDDHNYPALMIRPDGRYVAVYAKHNSDFKLRYRLSEEPHDPTSWTDEQHIDTGGGTTYANVYRLPDDDDGAGRTYCFTRARNFDPNVVASSDAGETWEYAGKLLSRPGGGNRPYVRYASDGETIHFITTEEHPRGFQNGIYHAAIRDGVMYDSNDDVVTEQVLDEFAVGPDPADLSPIYQPGEVFDGVEMGRAWTVDLAVHEGNPIALFSARAEDEATDHRYFYARHDGDDWAVAHVAKAGRYLYSGEKDYTGLAAVDPSDPRRVVISTAIDPTDESELEHRHLFAGEMTDTIEDWTWTDLTPDTTADNIRPFIARWEVDHTALVWLSGRYESWRTWDTQVIAAIDPIEQGLAYNGPDTE